MFDYKPYAGIGSRETPTKILTIMTIVAYHLAKQGWTLRSGGAPGADTAFENGAWAAVDSDGTTRPEIYLPWRGFEGRDSAIRHEPDEKAYGIARQHHPNWDVLSDGAKKLHARNVHQVLGYNLDTPHLASFVLCWTPNGRGGGGTGQALRIAHAYGIKEIYDLANDKDLRVVREFIPAILSA